MSSKVGRWALIVHGGAKEIAPDEEADNRAGLAQAIEAGRQILDRGGTAVEAVEASVRVLEHLPAFNAGNGSVLNSKGEVEMCAAIMEGEKLQVGAVGAITGVAHPVSVARTMLPLKSVLLVGTGAYEFARDHHAELCSGDSLVTHEAQRELAEHDTVGAVALDMNGNLAAATSTGGLSGAPKGRMGDSALPGGGYYADNAIGAVAFSGHGEGIARLALAAQVMASINRDGPEAAISKAVAQMERVGGDAGGIAIDRNGQIGWAHNSPNFAVASIAQDDDAPGIWLKKDEQQRG
jgi:L-asparaginase / beta-aspartyl-peptidase